MKYTFTIGMTEYESDSRDAKKHLRNHGGEECNVYNKHGQLVSQAKRDENGNCYSCYVPKE